MPVVRSQNGGRMISASVSVRLWALLVRGLGLVLLLGGIGVAFMGPLEMHCFYLFSRGGPFYYQGFGVGSFMFANLAAQISGYYIIGALLVILGYGHLVLRGWARHLSLALARVWVVAGIPLVLAFLFVLLSSKDVSMVGGILAVVLAAISYPAVPWAVSRLYRTPGMRGVLADPGGRACWLNERIVPRLALGILYGLVIVGWHLLILLNGLFPLAGQWLTGLEGIMALDVAILLLAALTWGTIRGAKWAWWGALAYFLVVGALAIVTLARSTWAEMLTAAGFGAYEVSMLAGMPLRGIHMAALVGLPLLLLLGMIVRERGSVDRAASS